MIMAVALIHTQYTYVCANSFISYQRKNSGFLAKNTETKVMASGKQHTPALLV